MYVVIINRKFGSYVCMYVCMYNLINSKIFKVQLTTGIYAWNQATWN
jgi:hypothetical protein